MWQLSYTVVKAADFTFALPSEDQTIGLQPPCIF